MKWRSTKSATWRERGMYPDFGEGIAFVSAVQQSMLRKAKRRKIMKTKTNVKAGGVSANHNERLNSAPTAAGLKVRTNVKAGGRTPQHNERLSSAATAPSPNDRKNIKS